MVVCVITSNRFRDDYSVLLENSDLEIGVLPESSVIKTHKLFTIEQTKIIRNFLQVNEDLYEKVEEKLKEFFEMDNL